MSIRGGFPTRGVQCKAVVAIQEETAEHDAKFVSYDSEITEAFGNGYSLKAFLDDYLGPNRARARRFLTTSVLPGIEERFGARTHLAIYVPDLGVIVV